MKRTNSNDKNVPSFARGTASSRARQESKFSDKASNKIPLRTPVSSRPTSRVSIRPGSSASTRTRPVSRNKDYSRGMAGRKLVRLDEVEDDVEKKSLFHKGFRRIDEESSKSNIPQIGKGKGRGKENATLVSTHTITLVSISDAQVDHVNANANNEPPASTVVLDDDMSDDGSNSDASERSFHTAREDPDSDSEQSFHTAPEWLVSESDDEIEREAARAFMESRIICEHWEANMKRDLEIREEIEMLRLSAGNKM
ncbi:hypothetical protein VI817_004786 [Penicillium citrinum]|nr:hypothetical protein VI817_004786 [Penicillium citrinum]